MDVDAVVVGSGPNGLAAALTMAASGLRVQVIEWWPSFGGGCRTEELTVPGFCDDVCSAAHPLAVASPFFKRFDLAARGVTLARPEVEFAHPLDGGRAAVVSRSVAETAARLGADGRAYRRLLGPLTSHMDEVLDAILAPLRTLPAHPLHAANYGRRAVLPASVVARRWDTQEARAIMAGGAGRGGGARGPRPQGRPRRPGGPVRAGRRSRGRSGGGQAPGPPLRPRGPARRRRSVPRPGRAAHLVDLLPCAGRLGGRHDR